MNDRLLLRKLIAGVKKMKAHEQCGGDGWWDGWEQLRVLVDLDSQDPGDESLIDYKGSGGVAKPTVLPPPPPQGDRQ